MLLQKTLHMSQPVAECKARLASIQSYRRQFLMVTRATVRPNCTEVTLAVHYDIKNKLFAWLDRRLHFVDNFVTAELRSIRAHFEGIAASYLDHARVLPMFQTATA